MPSRCTSCLSSSNRSAADVDDPDVVTDAGPSCSAHSGDDAADKTPRNPAAALVDIPVVADALTFDESLAAETRKLDELADTERWRQRRRWRQEVDMMRNEMVPLDRRRRCGSESPTKQDSVTERPTQPQQRRRFPLPRNYFRRFFDTAGFAQQTVRIWVERGTLVLGACRLVTSEQSDNTDTKHQSSVRICQQSRTRYFRYPIPPSVDLSTIRAILSTDGVLLVEADTGTSSLSSPDQSVGSSGTESGAHPAQGKREKIGKPVFCDDEDGKRRMRLLIDIGDSFRPNDIYVQAIKSDRFQVWAKRQFKTPVKALRAKYKREFELNEKIKSSTLWAQLEPNGRLVVGAVAKRQPPQPPDTGDASADVEVAEGGETNDRNDGGSVDGDTTSLPPETNAADCADCPGVVVVRPDSDDNGHFVTM